MCQTSHIHFVHSKLERHRKFVWKVTPSTIVNDDIILRSKDQRSAGSLETKMQKSFLHISS